MADVAAMDIVIGADVTKAIAGLEGLSTELSDLSKTGVTSIGQLNRAMQTLREAGLKTQDVGTLAKYNQALEKLAGESTRLKNVGLGEGLKKIKPGASEATQALTDLGRVAQDAPFGFIGIQNNITPLIDSFGRLSAESKKTGTSLLSSLGAALSGPAGLGIAISIVTAALTFAQTGFSAWTRGFGAGAKAVDEAKKANEDYAKSIKEIDKSVVESSQKQVQQLQILTQVARDSSAALNVRLDAATKAQNDYLPTLTKEQILYGDITEAINKTTEAIINQGLAQAETAKAAKAAAIVYDPDLITKRKAAQLEYNKALAEFSKLTTLTPKEVREPIENAFFAARNAFQAFQDQFLEADMELAVFKERAANFTKQTGAISEVEKITNKLKESIEVLNKKAEATGASFKDEKISAYKSALDSLINAGLAPTDAKIKELIANVRALGGNFDETKKKISDVTKILQELTKARQELGRDPIIKPLDKPIEEIKLIRKALIDLIRAGASESIISKTTSDLEKIQTEALPRIGELIKQTFGKIPDIAPPNKPISISVKPAIDDDQLAQLKGQVEQFFESHGIELPVNFQQMGSAETKKLQHIGEEAARVVELGFKLPKNFEFLKDEDREALVKEFEEIGKIVKDTVADTFITIAENIGNLKNPLAGIFELLGNSLITLGKQVVITSDLVAAISKSLNAAFSGLPAAGIAVGLGLIVAGSLLKHFAPFAEGGIVTGPTRALIGEAGPEVVFPLDRLREFIQPAQSQVVVLETRVRGSDIWLSQSRTNERRGRTY